VTILPLCKKNAGLDSYEKRILSLGAGGVEVMEEADVLRSAGAGMEGVRAGVGGGGRTIWAVRQTVP
jgi:alpha-D-ribose 1-methylphosphonate 5-triphosphate synthase subunit PhnG